MTINTLHRQASSPEKDRIDEVRHRMDKMPPGATVNTAHPLNPCIYRVFTCARTGAKLQEQDRRPVSESSSLVGRPPSGECREAPRREASPASLCLPGWQGTGCWEGELGLELRRKKWEGGWDSGQQQRDRTGRKMAQCPRLFKGNPTSGRKMTAGR